HEGFTAVYAEDGREALDHIEREPPDIVLTDMQMPELDGLALVEETKARFPLIPVVLMTAHGSEEIAVAALKTGAASYVPKQSLLKDLGPTLREVLEMAHARRERQQVFGFMTGTVSHFVLGYEPAEPQALISYLQDGLRMMNLCGATELLRVGTALREALTHAIEHGNLEIGAALQEAGDCTYDDVLKARMQQPPYSERRVHVEATLSRSEVVFVVRDEGPGFDWSALPAPDDVEHFRNPIDKGLRLMRLFMDEVRFNDAGNEVTLIKRRED
ncbi:MAG: response regulator, partial [Candidatus Tectomicrobia bacterium]|nr:response regulator [Candidatus Tectomicrobia bacterium]